MRAFKNIVFCSGFCPLPLRTDESARVYGLADRYCYSTITAVIQFSVEAKGRNISREEFATWLQDADFLRVLEEAWIRKLS